MSSCSSFVVVEINCIISVLGAHRPLVSLFCGQLRLEGKARMVLHPMLHSHSGLSLVTVPGPGVLSSSRAHECPPVGEGQRPRYAARKEIIQETSVGP